MKISQDLKGKILKAQRDEITEHIIYKKLSTIMGDAKKRSILEKISSQELSHYKFWKRFTSADVPPNHLKILFYYLVSKFLGLNFGLRLMEKGEKSAQTAYKELKKID